MKVGLTMYSYVIPLYPQHYRQVYQFLMQDEPWQLIPLDALIRYRLTHPRQRWFAEIRAGIFRGVIFQDKELVHFAYQEAPEPHSPLYAFLKKYIPSFTTHGKKEVLAPLMERLLSREVFPCKESLFVTQSPSTGQLINRPLHVPEQLVVRLAIPQEIQRIWQLYQGSAVEREVDHELIEPLIWQHRVLVAEYRGKVVGTIMRLKESRSYSLLGALYVAPAFRRQGIARLLGQTMLRQVIKEKKKACFYYERNKELDRFYRQGQFMPLGTWVTYAVPF